MLQLTIKLPESLSQEVEASGLSCQQLGRVMTYLLEMYLKIEQSQRFIQIASTDEVKSDAHPTGSMRHNGRNLTPPLRQNSNSITDMTSISTSIVDTLAGSLGPAAPDELDYFNTADLSWQRFAEWANLFQTLMALQFMWIRWFFHIFLRDAESNARSFFQRVEHGDIQAYTSILSFDELAYRQLLALIRDKYKGSPLDHLRKDETNLIDELYPQIAPKIELLRQFTNLNLVDVTADDLDAMSQNILDYKLRPRDALHLAAMQKVKCFNLLSEDSDFTRVSNIQQFTLI